MSSPSNTEAAQVAVSPRGCDCLVIDCDASFYPEIFGGGVRGSELYGREMEFIRVVFLCAAGSKI